MKRHLRLRQAKDFERLRREGSAYRHSFLVLSLAPNGLKHNRYGFVVGKRSGNAVIRNHVRRKLREIVRHHHDCLVPGYDIVIIARPVAVHQAYPALSKALIQVFDDAALLRSKDNVHP